MNNEKGLSPEKVEELMKWIDETAAYYRGPKDDETDRAYGNGMLEVKKQLQALLSSPQAEKQVGEGGITEKDFEAIIHQSINTCGNKKCDCTKDVCKEESEGGKQCFSLAQRMVSQALASKNAEIEIKEGLLKSLRERVGDLKEDNESIKQLLDKHCRTPSITTEEVKDRNGLFEIRGIVNRLKSMSTDKKTIDVYQNVIDEIDNYRKSK